MEILTLVGGIIGLFLLIGIVWRLSSRRRSLPCPSWLRWFVELDNPFAKTCRAETILQHLDLRPGMTVLDVGCGPGRVAIPIARHLAQQGGDVVAMDIQEEMLQRVREKALKENLTNIQFLQGDMERVNLEPERFDRALLVTVLGEIPDREAALREIFQALKPGGFLSVSEMIFDPHFQSRDTVARLGLSAGFREGHFYGNRFAFTLNLEKPQSSANT
ncbi:MAG: class I SAM-dependent methyltransferase [Candidatus Omnitrophica bacterium]|nr:class I SAM-dependent methyltransferase [Candidatus Omnitrophota bacterium]MCA9443469.1 class I SAM-dependent methyltransferase [Candidatus Omnitrophota bacterium]MCB9782762.1 class I SAM-dependent methyltransferase [Candidatus Omnitrophota bacterium]